MNKKEFLKEVAKRFKYVREPIRMTGQCFGELQGYSMWIAEIDNQTVEEIGITFWVKHNGWRSENVIAVQPSIGCANGVPMIVEELKEILNKEKEKE